MLNDSIVNFYLNYSFNQHVNDSLNRCGIRPEEAVQVLNGEFSGEEEQKEAIGKCLDSVLLKYYIFSSFFYPQLIALRKSETYGETVVYGAFRALFEEEHDLIAFAREREGQRLVVLANFREEPRTLQLEAPVKEILLTNRACTEEEQAQAAEGVITLDAYQVIIIECQ